MKQRKPNYYYTGSRPELKQFIPKTYSRVLEIGCGDGSFAHNLIQKCDYWGVEPNKEQANLAKKNVDIIFNATYHDASKNLPDKYFDLIICNDIIEHVTDHDELLLDLKDKLKKNGVIMGSIPNVRYVSNLMELLFQKDWKYKDEGILDSTHLRFFTKKSIVRALTKNGYKITEIKGINSIKIEPYPFSNLVKSILALLLGLDTRYLQFAFSAKKHD